MNITNHPHHETIDEVFVSHHEISTLNTLYLAERQEQSPPSQHKGNYKHKEKKKKKQYNEVQSKTTS